MILRIWTLAVAVLLLAAPAHDAAIENPDNDAQIEQLADALVTQIAVSLAAPTEARVAIVRSENPLPPSPALARVFRPPRPSFG